MRAPILGLIVLILLLLFIGCLDEQMAVRRSGGRNPGLSKGGATWMGD